MFSIVLLVAIGVTYSNASAQQDLTEPALPGSAFFQSESRSTEPSCAKPDERTLAAIVPVATDHGSFASGIVVDVDRVLTAAHALQGAGQFFVKFDGGYSLADLVTIDHTHDLAVLAVDTIRIEPLVLAGFALSQSEPVWAAGYPHAQDISMSAGVLKQSVGDALHTSASIDSGQSGGGLLSCFQGHWSLAGMLRGYGAYQQGEDYIRMDNYSVSVGGTTIAEFLGTYH